MNWMQFKLRLKGRLGFFGLVFLYALIVFGCVYSLATAGDLSMGRNPVANFIKTATEFARPSFVDVWLGDPAYEYKSDDGTVLRSKPCGVLELGLGLVEGLFDIVPGAVGTFF